MRRFSIGCITIRMVACIGMLAVLSSTQAVGATATVAQPDASSGHAHGSDVPPAKNAVPEPPANQAKKNRITREGVTVEFSAKPVGRDGDLMEGDYSEVTFRVTDASTGQPVRSLSLGAWMDAGQPLAAKEGQTIDCRQKMGLFLSGRVGIRPMIDLNSYYVLTLNRDSTISVVDPHVGMAGRTYLYANIVLPRPGADWAKTEDDKRLFVTIPRGGYVAVVDTENFKVSGGITVGGTPVRIALQRDGRYLWVGNDSREAAESGVVAVDPTDLSVVARIPTGRGHHELAFSSDERQLFVTNREEGTVSVIDVAKLAKVADIKTGPLPISLAYSRLSEALYVADGKTGEIAAIDGRTNRVAARIKAKPGLGPMGFTEDGRWALVLNSTEHAVHAVDVASNRLAHSIPVGGRPYHLAFTPTYAYVRSLDSAQVSMIPLSQLGREQAPPVTTFAAGDEAPGKTGPGMVLAGPIAAALGEAAVVVANPTDGNVYYYMEGMVAPMATFRNYGHRPAALTVVNRSLREKEPGVYKTTVQLPAAGTYDVGFLLDAPRLAQCFSAEVQASPKPARTGPPIKVEYLVKDRRIPVGESVKFAFKLTDADTGKPRAGLGDVRVLYYMAPGRIRHEATAREVGDGVYEATLSIREAGGYYVYLAVPSEKIRFGDLTYLSVMAQTRPAASVGAN